MTTFFQAGGPQAAGPHYGTAAEPQQYYPAAGYPAAPVPQVDHHHPYPVYQPGQPAWSEPMSQPLSQPVIQQYQPPTWTTQAPATNRNKLVAAFIAVALLLVAGAVTVIVVLNKGDSAAPGGPQTPLPSAPMVSAPTSADPVQPQPFPSGPTAESPAVPPVPAQTVPAQTVPAQTVPAQTEPAQTEPAQTVPAQPAGVPGQQEAEQAAGGFVDALRSSDFAGAAGYICSAKAAAFAAGASQLSTKVQLETLGLAEVEVTGSSAVMTMTYQAVGQAQTMHESLPMTVESGSWKICN